MTGPGVRRGLSELIPGSTAAIRPRPAKVRHYGAPVLTGRPHAAVGHNHRTWELYSASCPACRRVYGPGSAVALAAKLHNLSIGEWLREWERRKRDNDPWLREINEKSRQIRARLAETQPRKA